MLLDKMDQDTEESANYIHITQNEYLNRKHKKQKEEDIATCECKFDFSDADTACGERCWNVLTSTECTPGYCHCGVYCKNQKFQKCQYAKTRLFKTGGRGWGLLADENIKAGQFIIEYCGEVISWKEAKKRAHAYENEGLLDAFIISLNASECIDATKKGSLARFINHSCQPNCETRKWTVLGEIRVGIFAKQDIPAGTELAYNYNFEWYGGAKVRCLCGAASCCGFLGAKSRGFQEDTYLWEDDDDRYSVEKIPLYDSAEDEPLSKYSKTKYSSNVVSSTAMNTSVEPLPPEEPSTLATQPLDLIPVESVATLEVKSESKEANIFFQHSQQALSQNNANAIVSRVRSNSAVRNYQIGPGMSKKRSKPLSNGKLKSLPQNKVDAKYVAQLLASKEAQNEVLKYEEIKNDATSELDSLYNDIRPAIEEHERDNQDCVATSVAEKWIEACCAKLKAEFDLYSSVVRNVAYHPQRQHGDGKPPHEGGNENKLQYLTN